ncbi:hypothetical protein Tco_0077422 [Tanacetum coccineum]
MCTMLMTWLDSLTSVKDKSFDEFQKLRTRTIWDGEIIYILDYVSGKGGKEKDDSECNQELKKAILKRRHSSLEQKE